MTKATAAKTYRIVRTYESKSKPGDVHTVKRHIATGALSCDCMSWIMRPTCTYCDAPTKTEEKGVYRCVRHAAVPRACKHIRHYLAHQPTTAGMAEALPVAPMGGQTATQMAVALAAKRSKSPAEAAVFEAAITCGIRGNLHDWEWRKLAAALAPLFAVASAAVGNEPVDDVVRHIILED